MARRRPEPSAGRPFFEHRTHPRGQRLLVYTTKRRSGPLSSTSSTVAVFFFAPAVNVAVGLFRAILCLAAQGGGTARHGCVTRATAILLAFSALLAGAGLRHSRLCPDVAPIYCFRGVSMGRLIFCRRAASSAIHLAARLTGARLLREERLAMPVGAAVADLDLFGDATQPLADAARTLLRGRRGAMTAALRFYAVH